MNRAAAKPVRSFRILVFKCQVFLFNLFEVVVSVFLFCPGLRTSSKFLTRSFINFNLFEVVSFIKLCFG